MRRFLCATLSLLVLAACGDGDPGSSDSGADTTSDSSDTSATEPGDTPDPDGCQEHADCTELAATLDTCEAALCDTATGECLVGAAKDWTPCDDADACSLGDVCLDGVCAGQEAKACDDGNPCTDDTCTAADGCTFIENEAPCDDGDPATLDDVCSGGTCAGVPEDACGPQCCDDIPLLECEDVSWDEATDQCLIGHVDDGTPCEDGNPLTTDDVCVLGVCEGQDPGCLPEDCAALDDGDLCNGQLVCSDDGFPCVTDPDSIVVCDTDGLGDCESVACEPASGECIVGSAPDGSPCSDGDPLTTDDACLDGLCVGQGAGCQPGDCAVYDDGDLCNGTFMCADDGSGACVIDPITVVVCDTGGLGVCETVACEPASGECVVSPADDGSPCDDGNPLTNDDACLDGLCVGQDPGCQPEDCAAFEDDNLCNGNLVCSDGGFPCIIDPASVVVCDTDGLSDCETVACEPASGECVVSALPDGSACDDGDPCTLDDVCGAASDDCAGLGGASIVLHHVTIDGDEVRVGYSKSFATCGHLLSTANQIQHVSNVFCAEGECLETVTTTSEVTASIGDAVKLCHGNNYNECSEPVVVTAPAVGCAGTPDPCDDDDPCTADACDPEVGGCVHVDTCGPEAPTCQLYLGEYKLNAPVVTRMNPDGSDPVPLGLVPSEDWLLVGLWVDPVGQAMTWVHGSTPGRIARRALEGGDVEVLVSGLSQPRGLTVDPDGGWMWWASGGSIQRATTEGADVTTLVDAGGQLGRPTFDPTTGDLWFGDLTNDVIRKASADGSGVVTVVTQHTNDPVALAVDHTVGKIYWVDAQTVTNHVARADLDGSDAEVVWQGEVASSGLTGVAVDGMSGGLWWADEIGAGEKGVWRAGLTGAAAALVHESPDGWNAGVLFASTVGCPP